MMRVAVVLVCFLLPLNVAAQDEFWCWDADEVEVTVDGDIVRILHHAALLNCCPDPITFDVHVGDASILVEQQSMYLCDCDCCWDLSMSLDDVPPGPWNLIYRWFDLEIWDWTELVFQIEVPDVDQPLSPYVSAQDREGCLETTSTPEFPVPECTWSVMKGLYR